MQTNTWHFCPSFEKRFSSFNVCHLYNIDMLEFFFVFLGNRKRFQIYLPLNMLQIQVLTVGYIVQKVFTMYSRHTEHWSNVGQWHLIATPKIITIIIMYLPNNNSLISLAAWIPSSAAHKKNVKSIRIIESVESASK